MAIGGGAKTAAVSQNLV